jgi:four helix bundle protein
MQDFRKLTVWQRAHAFSLEIRRVTESFPRDLRAQIRSAAESIVNNIVEGCGASSRKEFARYLDISIKSASETDYQLQFARDIEVLAHDVWHQLSDDVVEIRRMTFGLRRTVLEADDRDRKKARGSRPPTSRAPIRDDSPTSDS